MRNFSVQFVLFSKLKLVIYCLKKSLCLIFKVLMNVTNIYLGVRAPSPKKESVASCSLRSSESKQACYRKNKVEDERKRKKIFRRT